MQWSELLSTERLKGGATAPDSPSLNRSPFQRDFDRIGYSLPFRRLQNKTQVHTLPNNDHVRNRLTHSLEASTIARSLATAIGQWLKGTGVPNICVESLGECAQAATLAHDIGNPPFGHPGEAAIRAWFRGEKGKTTDLTLQPIEEQDFTRFNGNAQGFRILTQYCHGYDSPGLELTCATLAAFTKYPMGPSSESPGPFKEIGLFSRDESTFALIAARTGLPKFPDGTWARHPLAFLVEAADDIAYLTADIEDGVELGMLPSDKAKVLFRECAQTADEPPCNVLSRLRSILIGRLINDSVREFKRDYECIIAGQRHESLLKSNLTRERLKEVAYEEIFASAVQIRRDLAGKEAIEGLLKRLATTICDFKACQWSLADLRTRAPHKWRLLRLIDAAGAEGASLGKLTPLTSDSEVLHTIVDYIAGQTDRYAIELWQNVRGLEL